MSRLLKELQIDIAEIPAHLCHDTTIQAILKPRCIVDHITFNPVDNKYCIEARAHSADTIPSLVHLGLNRFDNGQHLLHIWPLSLETNDITSENYLNMQFQLQEQNRPIGISTLNTLSILYGNHPVLFLFLLSLINTATC
jgi:hypothetical protein